MKSKVTSDSNLTSVQQRGVKSLIRRVKEKEIVVFQTDKSGRFSVDTPENYRESVRPHVGVDAEVDLSKHKEVEKLHTAFHGLEF